MGRKPISKNVDWLNRVASKILIYNIERVHQQVKRYIEKNINRYFGELFAFLEKARTNTNVKRNTRELEV